MSIAPAATIDQAPERNIEWYRYNVSLLRSSENIVKTACYKYFVPTALKNNTTGSGRVSGHV